VKIEPITQTDIRLPEGVQLRQLLMHRDDRGSVTELLRGSWSLGPPIVQWNIVCSDAGVARGVHVHLERHDLLSVIHGRASIGLRDLRRKSTTAGLAALVELSGEQLSVLTIPPGVLHGFYSNESSVLLSAFSHEWDPSDDYGCYWADPQLGIPWPSTIARISQKDGELPPFEQLLASLPVLFEGTTA
jgi:dTDP-4-dehydrorhamnose 3,5-epimerase